MSLMNLNKVQPESEIEKDAGPTEADLRLQLSRKAALHLPKDEDLVEQFINEGGGLSPSKPNTEPDIDPSMEPLLGGAAQPKPAAASAKAAQNGANSSKAEAPDKEVAEESPGTSPTRAFLSESEMLEQMSFQDDLHKNLIMSVAAGMGAAAERVYRDQERTKSEISELAEREIQAYEEPQDGPMVVGGGGSMLGFLATQLTRRKEGWRTEKAVGLMQERRAELGKDLSRRKAFAKRIVDARRDNLIADMNGIYDRFKDYKSHVDSFNSAVSRSKGWSDFDKALADQIVKRKTSREALLAQVYGFGEGVLSDEEAGDLREKLKAVFAENPDLLKSYEGCQKSFADLQSSVDRAQSNIGRLALTGAYDADIGGKYMNDALDQLQKMEAIKVEPVGHVATGPENADAVPLSEKFNEMTRAVSDKLAEIMNRIASALRF